MLHLKSAVRALLGSRGFSAIVIVTMAAGIAANTAIFSVYDQLVLNPVTIPDPSSLITIWFNNPQRNTQSPNMSIPRYDELRGEVRAFSSIGRLGVRQLHAHRQRRRRAAQRACASARRSCRRSASMPARGRNFTAEEDVPNGPAVCIVSHELWQTQFGGRESLDRRHDATERDRVAGRRHHAATPRASVSPGAGVRAACLRGRRPDAGTGAGRRRVRPGDRPAARPASRMDQARAELEAFSAGLQAAPSRDHRREQHQRAARVRGVAGRRLPADDLHAARRGRMRAADCLRERRVAVPRQTA